MQSAPAPRATTNPYITMLSRTLKDDPAVDSRHFTWRSALTRRIDVFHAHWPEILVSGRSPLKKAVRQALFALLLAKFAVTRTAIVRTVHNLELPTGISRREVALLRLFDRMTHLRIRINPTTEIPADQPFVTILHGHYRDWFSEYPASPPERGRIAYFGLIRRYKGAERLVRTFREIPRDKALTLTLAGKPSTPELASELLALVGDDPRITTRLEFLPDAELVDEVTRSELVVLPYREMHNSGGALTALSLNRPVLVPDNAATRALADEVGPGWVQTYHGDLSADALVAAVGNAPSLRAGRPDLSARDWAESGRLHVEAFRRAAGRA